MAINPHILIIAGTDPTGAAGIVQDIVTASCYNVKTSIAITSVNVQDNQHVYAKMPVQTDILIGQIQTALKANTIHAIKIGMIGTTRNIHAVNEGLQNFDTPPIILDPVINASSGGCLVDATTIFALKQKLLPKTFILTPNLPELALLTDELIATNAQQAILQAKKLLLFGIKYVLIKGGHSDEKNAIDYLVSHDAVVDFSSPRLNISMRGTGCTLSSAIACEIAKGATAHKAVENAKTFVYQLLKQKAEK